MNQITRETFMIMSRQMTLHAVSIVHADAPPRNMMLCINQQ